MLLLLLRLRSRLLLWPWPQIKALRLCAWICQVLATVNCGRCLAPGGGHRSCGFPNLKGTIGVYREGREQRTNHDSLPGGSSLHRMNTGNWRDAWKIGQAEDRMVTSLWQ